MKKLTRRTVLAASTAVGLTACSKLPQARQFTIASPQAGSVFAHGIASGDPQDGSVIIWTRITPSSNQDQMSEPVVIWTIWPVGDNREQGQNGQVFTKAGQDWTVKVDVEGLTPGTPYNYDFTYQGVRSPAGRTQTLPRAALGQARFAVVSCANFQAGYFSVYDHIARDHSFDAVIHLGDYFYEYGVDGWGGALDDPSRQHQPVHETVTLADYRMRHAQYRTDASLQAMTAIHPLIAIWDDHETSNDSYKDGAENHQPDQEGDWNDRKAAALQAYYEWMPVREPARRATREQRSQTYSYGDLLTLVTLETRLTARAEPINLDDYTESFDGEADVKAFKNTIIGAPDRPMLGAEQTGRVVEALSASKASGQPWRLLANQIVMGRIFTPDLTPHVDEASLAALRADWPGVDNFVKNSAYALPLYPDSWDGYPWAREQFYGALEGAGLTDTVVLTGDAHEFWVNDLTRESGQKMGIELGTSAVSSPTLKSYFGSATDDYALLMTQSNQDVRYYNASYNGYIDLTVSQKSAQARLIMIDDVTLKDYSAAEQARFTLRKTKDSVKVTRPKGLNFKQRVLFSGLG